MYAACACVRLALWTHKFCEGDFMFEAYIFTHSFIWHIYIYICNASYILFLIITHQ